MVLEVSVPESVQVTRRLIRSHCFAYLKIPDPSRFALNLRKLRTLLLDWREVV